MTNTTGTAVPCSSTHEVESDPRASIDRILLLITRPDKGVFGTYFDVSLGFLRDYLPMLRALPPCERCEGDKSFECRHSALYPFLGSLLSCLEASPSDPMRTKAYNALDAALQLVQDDEPEAWAYLVTRLGFIDARNGDEEAAYAKWESVLERDLADSSVFDRLSLRAERAKDYARATELALAGAEACKAGPGRGRGHDAFLEKLEKRAARCAVKIPA